MQCAQFAGDAVIGQEVVLGHHHAVHYGDVLHPGQEACGQFRPGHLLAQGGDALVVLIQGRQVLGVGLDGAVEFVGIEVQLAEVEVAQRISVAGSLEVADGRGVIAQFVAAAGVAVVVQRALGAAAQQGPVLVACFFVLLVEEQFLCLVRALCLHHRAG